MDIIYQKPITSEIKKIIDTNFEYQKLYWYKEFKELTTSHNINFIDLALNKNENSVEHLKKNLNIFNKCDKHWNNKGHRLAVNQFLNSD